ncbi:AraC family transcriptional regulator [Rhizobium calliandrae]|uniref:AraC family transcriptional regulator n=1 Tax=Rhizobium calliandrae TaxID=1312182 RepID=A0ABT7KEC9_9HYPH|nr:AraC family transcriptional regulator [Rhizobium calliandrae]MDL2406826.1 AraC family transcriptional regulator [Rhizobium calliandrae]
MDQFAVATTLAGSPTITRAAGATGKKLGEILPTCRGCQLISTHTRRWSGIVATVFRFEAHISDAEVSYSSGPQRLVALVEGTGGEATLDLAFDSESDAEEVSNFAVFGRHAVTGRGSSRGNFAHLVIDFQSAELNPGNRTIADPRIMGLCHLLAVELREHNRDNLSYGESLVRALRALLARRETFTQSAARNSQLSPWRRRRVRAYLEENLSRNIPVTELAEMIGLSRSHFTRAFQVSFGATPHKWVLLARLERSKVLLFDGGMSIADIALDVGFLDQPHFTRTFTRLTGISPMAWLRQARSDSAHAQGNHSGGIDPSIMTAFEDRFDGFSQ